MTEPKTTTSPTPIADSIETPSTGPVRTVAPPEPEAWQPDLAALQRAAGDADVWAHQLSELVGHTTGSWIEDQTFAEWLRIFAQQVRQVENRAALFQIANTVLPTQVSGDPSFALLAFRDQVAQSFRPAANL